MPSHYDAIVLGAGGVGSAAMWRLARRGVSVLGVDRFEPPHDQGSSHAQTRIIRQAYFEHPDYVPLCQRAYEMWDELEALSGERLFERTGLIEVGPEEGAVVNGVLQAAEQHNLPVDRLAAAEAQQRWPQFRVPEGLVVVHEPTGGVLHVERCVKACLDAALALGAELRCGVTFNGWRCVPDRIVVETTAGKLSADRLIVTAGPWAGGLLEELGVKLQIRRKSLFWFGVSSSVAPGDHGPQAMPPFLFELPAGVFYGFPAVAPWGVKIGDHAAGRLLSKPEEIDRSVDPAEEQLVKQFAQSHLPGLSAESSHHATCYYTMSPDEHFVVDRLPSDERVAFAAGLSGHGFKFTPVLGEALADLALDGVTHLPVGFLSLGRFES